MLKDEGKLSSVYHDVASALANGWRGTYGELADKVGYTATRRAPQVMGRLVKSFSLRHEDWDDGSVYYKGS